MALSRPIAACTLVAFMTGLVHAQQSPPQQPPQTQTPPPPKSPDDLDRIKAALKRPNTIILTDTQVRFYVEIRAKYPSVEEMFRGVDLLYGPRAGGPAMTHAEYLSMVTPRDTIASSGGIKPT